MTSQRVKDATDTAGERCKHQWIPHDHYPATSGLVKRCAKCWLIEPMAHALSPAAPSDNKPERSIADETGGGR